MTQFELRRRPLPAADHLPASLPPLLRRLYASRGVHSGSELARSASALLNPALLKDNDHAARLLADAIMADRQLVVIGDFDADGATSTALCVLALRAMGARRVEFLVPNRFDYGYGLSPEIVADAVAVGAELIITVDSGISCHAGVAAANAAGIAVVVTDHHLPGERLPPAAAIVNPNRLDCLFPSKVMAGVGVAFYVMSALRAELRQRGYFAACQLAEPNLAELLDLVALGTVADVVRLDAHNRVLVHQGLARIRAGRCRPGIAALIRVAKRQQAVLSATDLGFALGPRLNAAGRLDDMSLGIRLLLCDDALEADELALQLDDLNRERREIEAGMQQEALAHLDHLGLDGQVPQGISLFRDDWHQGVIGILAGRIKERFHRPTVAFAPGGSDDELKGSGRSIEGLHLRDLLESLNSRHPGLIRRFGGHAMAAGLTIARARFADFAHIFAEAVAAQLSNEQLNGVIWSDGELSDAELSLDSAALLRDGGPWGQGFPEPLFDGEFVLRQQRLVGSNHLKLQLESSSGRVLDAIAFNVDLKHWPAPAVTRVRAAYQLDINQFRGVTSLQLRVAHLWPL